MYSSVEPETTEGVHPHRASGRDRHYRHPDRAPAARRAEGPRGRRTHELLQQHEANRPGAAQPRERRRLPAAVGIRLQPAPAGNPLGAQTQGHSSLMHLLPFIEQENITRSMDTELSVIDPRNWPPQLGTQPAASAQVKSYICPSAPERTARPTALTSSRLGLPNAGPFVIGAPTTRRFAATTTTSATPALPASPLAPPTAVVLVTTTAEYSESRGCGPPRASLRQAHRDPNRRRYARTPSCSPRAPADIRSTPSEHR